MVLFFKTELLFLLQIPPTDQKCGFCHLCHAAKENSESCSKVFWIYSGNPWDHLAWVFHACPINAEDHLQYELQNSEVTDIVIYFNFSLLTFELDFRLVIFITV